MIPMVVHYRHEERSRKMNEEMDSRTLRLQIRVSKEEKEQIKKEALKQHLSVSSYVRSKLLASN